MYSFFLSGLVNLLIAPLEQTAPHTVQPGRQYPVSNSMRGVSIPISSDGSKRERIMSVGHALPQLPQRRQAVLNCSSGNAPGGRIYIFDLEPEVFLTISPSPKPTSVPSINRRLARNGEFIVFFSVMRLLNDVKISCRPPSGHNLRHQMCGMAILIVTTRNNPESLSAITPAGCLRKASKKV